MNYIGLTCELEEVNPWRDIIISDLAEISFESFEETDNGLKAYCQANQYNSSQLEELLNSYHINVKHHIEEIEDQNWNATWESSFDSILVDDWCLIRAPFHESVSVEQEIVIEPKMSFGTGHHQTTYMMVQWLNEINCKESNVLDMGTGTAVLAILAEKLGAQKVEAIDNEEWAYENALENVALNNCSKIHVSLGEGESISNDKFDIILANINRNALTVLFSEFKKKLSKNGKLIVSGFLNTDLNYMEELCSSHGFKISNIKERETWLSLCIQNI